MRLNLKLLLICILCIDFSGLIGQINYRNGYIISLSNDTLTGFINDGGTIRNMKMCQFKSGRNSQVKRYYPGDIKSFRFIDDKLYQSKMLPNADTNTIVFAEVLIEGYVSLFYYWKDKEMKYFIQKGDGPMVGLINKQIISTTNTQMYFNYMVPKFYSEVYLDSLYSIFKDCRRALERLVNVSYKAKSLINIIKIYNQSCSGTTPISYVKDLKRSGPTKGIYSGLSFSKVFYFDSNGNEFEIQSNFVSSLPIGLYYNKPLTFINQNLSAQIELALNYINFNRAYVKVPDLNQKIILSSGKLGIPVLLKYTFPGSKFSYSVAAGKESTYVVKSKVSGTAGWNRVLYKFQKGGWFFEFGNNYMIKSKYDVFTNLRIQATENIILEDDFIMNPYSNLNYINYGLIKSYSASLLMGIRF
jgi:hypothetical protein